MKMTQVPWIAALMGCLAAVPTGAKAQQYTQADYPGTVTISEASYHDIMTRLDSLETALAEEKKADGWKDVSSEKWTQKINGRFMIDYANFAAQNAGSRDIVPDAQNFVDFRRMYLGIEGEGYGIYEYKFEVDLSPALAVRNSTGLGETFDGPVQLKDVYLGVKEVPLFGTVLVGHFKVPISLEELTSSRYITFMERHGCNIFVPQRELGVAAYNKNAAETATIGYGLFFDNLNEIAKERLDDNQGTTLAVRGTWLPYYDEPSKGRYLVHTGAAWRYTDDQDDSFSFAPREEVGLGPRWTDTGTIKEDGFNVLQGELAAVFGRFSVQTEMLYVPVMGSDLEFFGTYLYGSWFLTGESRKYRRDRGTFDRVSPNTNFWIVRGADVGSGAIELAARYGYLDLSGTGAALAGQENDFTLGVNWYWNPNLKWMMNYIHTWHDYDDGKATAENDILAFSARLDF